MTSRPDRQAADRPPPPADDAIIGRVFWWSLAVIGLGAAGIGLVWWLGGRPTALPPPVEPAYVPPQRRQVSVEAPALPFTDITAQAGIEFVHVNGAYGHQLLPETMGDGCAFLDFDADGDQDLLFVNSSIWPWRQAAGERLPTLATQLISPVPLLGVGPRTPILTGTATWMSF